MIYQKRGCRAAILVDCERQPLFNSGQMFRFVRDVPAQSGNTNRHPNARKTPGHWIGIFLSSNCFCQSLSSSNPRFSRRRFRIIAIRIAATRSSREIKLFEKLGGILNIPITSNTAYHVGLEQYKGIMITNSYISVNYICQSFKEETKPAARDKCARSSTLPQAELRRC